MNYSVVIPVFNQLAYTENCLISLNEAGVPDSTIVLINNGSTDGTAQFLATRSALTVVTNSENRGCAFAWNQGAKARSADWTILLNNDVLIAPHWLEGLVSFAEEENFDIVSPAMCEGEYDYDLVKHAREFVQKMSDVRREDVASGVCFMVHRRVFEKIGFFDDDRKLGGYEDDEFFRRARQAGFKLAITGRAFLHHFGSVTQISIQQSWNRPNASLGDRDYYRRKYSLTWLKRQRERLFRSLQLALWRQNECRRFGVTLRSQRMGGVVRYL